MSAKASTWMPFYVGDYLRDTGRLTTENHGAYLLLIFDYWTSRAPLPDDDDQLAAIVRLPVARWQKARKVIANYFAVADGVWRHKRIDAEIERANGISKARQEAGKRGGKSKANAAAQPEQTPKQSPTPSQSPSQKEDVVIGREDPANEFIRIFDEVLILTWGHERARPFPRANDSTTARKWIEAGITPALCRDVAAASFAWLKAHNREPPDTLSYLTKPLANALAASKEPMPEGNANAGSRKSTPTPEQQTADRRGAIMSAINKKMAGGLGGDDQQRGQPGQSTGPNANPGGDPDIGSPAITVRSEILCGGDGQTAGVFPGVRTAGEGLGNGNGFLPGEPVGTAPGSADESGAENYRGTQVSRPAEASGDQIPSGRRPDQTPSSPVVGQACADAKALGDPGDIPAFLRRGAA